MPIWTVSWPNLGVSNIVEVNAPTKYEAQLKATKILLSVVKDNDILNGLKPWKLAQVSIATRGTRLKDLQVKDQSGCGQKWIVSWKRLGLTSTRRVEALSSNSAKIVASDKLLSSSNDFRVKDLTLEALVTAATTKKKLKGKPISGSFIITWPDIGIEDSISIVASSGIVAREKATALLMDKYRTDPNFLKIVELALIKVSYAVKYAPKRS